MFFCFSNVFYRTDNNVHKDCAYNEYLEGNKCKGTQTKKKKESHRVINVHFKISFLPYSDNCLILILVNRIHFEND